MQIYNNIFNMTRNNIILMYFNTISKILNYVKNDRILTISFDI